MQAQGQGCVAEVVCGELRLPALGGDGALGQSQDPGVVYQDVQGQRPGGGEGVDGRAVRQVEARDSDVVSPGGGLDIDGGALAGVGAAHGQGHLGACAGQRAGGLQPDPRSAAGHDGAFTVRSTPAITSAAVDSALNGVVMRDIARTPWVVGRPGVVVSGRLTPVPSR